MRNGHAARPSAAASTCTADGGGDSAGALTPIRRKRKRRTRCRSGRSRRRWHRRAIGSFGDCRGTPHNAARSSHCCARRGRGEGVGPTGVPQYPTSTRTQNSRPRGSTMVSFWVTVNGREYSERTRQYSPSRTPLAPRSNVPNFRKSPKRRLRAKEAARNRETRQDGRGAYEPRNLTS